MSLFDIDEQARQFDNAFKNASIIEAAAAVTKVNVKHTGYVIMLRLRKTDGTTFISPLFCDTKDEADLLASALNNVVAVLPVEWEE